MSKIGYNPITIEEGVVVTITGQNVSVKGPKGELSTVLPNSLKIEQKDKELLVTRVNEEIPSKALHGTYRSIVANMIEGVSKGFTKKLEVVGVGYRAKLEGLTLSLSLGYNHPIKFDAPEGITMEVPDEGTIIITGIDKQKVGEYAALIREIRKPEPYKGKGIRYEGEYVRRKSAKSAATKK